MDYYYEGVITRFLSNKERLLLSEEKEMPLVIEAKQTNDIEFLKQFVSNNSNQLLSDIAKYGAVLLRGFKVASDEDFEAIILSLKGLRGIGEAFMSEEGRVPSGKSQFVLHTNAIYKTGGTLYLGGFHSENYYSADVPSYLCFCCLKPSRRGGETGLLNTEKIYNALDSRLKQKLGENTFFVSKWLVSEVAKRYQITPEKVESFCSQYNLPIVGTKPYKFVLMYKPSVFFHPTTKKPALQINLFELPTLNRALRKVFMQNYQGKEWFWHRLVWRLPNFIFTFLEYVYLIFATLIYSPKKAIEMAKAKLNVFMANKRLNQPYQKQKVGSCFNEKEVNSLATLIRKYYSSCLWKKGDVLIIDNKKTMHAGMPGSGPRVVRAIICNPLEMNYTFAKTGNYYCSEREQGAIGYYMALEKEEGNKENINFPHLSLNTHNPEDK